MDSLDFSVGVRAFVIGLSQISFFFSYQHLFPAVLCSIVTRFNASGCFKCDHLPYRVLTCLCAGFLCTSDSLDFSAGVRAFVTGLSQISFFLHKFVCRISLRNHNYNKYKKRLP